MMLLHAFCCVWGRKRLQREKRKTTLEAADFAAAWKKIMSRRSYECYCLCLRKLERQGRDSLMDRMVISSSNNYTRKKWCCKLQSKVVCNQLFSEVNVWPMTEGTIFLSLFVIDWQRSLCGFYYFFMTHPSLFPLLMWLSSMSLRKQVGCCLEKCFYEDTLRCSTVLITCWGFGLTIVCSVCSMWAWKCVGSHYYP